MSWLSPITVPIKSAIWETDTRNIPKWKSAVLKILKMGYVIVRDLSDGQLTLRAMSLVYTTLLSLVPLLAVSFSVLKAFGVHNKLEPFLLNSLTAMGPKATEITAKIIGFVENMKIGVLGALGLGFLFYTVIALIQKIERTFNYTWRINQHRSFAKRVTDYLSVIIIGPVLIFSAIGLTASIMSTGLMQEFVSTDYIGPIVSYFTRLMPYLLIISAFTFFYILIPNTKVKLHAAFTGALVAGVLWQTTGLIFASFIVGSVKYTAIYSALATLIMFMIWLYLAWLILLIGASIAFYTQNPKRLTLIKHEPDPGIRLKEKLALMTILLVARNYYQNQPAWSLENLANHLNIPSDTMGIIIHSLEHEGILQSTADDPPTYLPAQPLDTTPLKNVLNAVRGENNGLSLYIPSIPELKIINDLTEQIDEALAKTLQGMTIKDLAHTSLPGQQ